MQQEDIEDSLDNLHAIVDVPKDKNLPIVDYRLFFLSFYAHENEVSLTLFHALLLECHSRFFVHLASIKRNAALCNIGRAMPGASLSGRFVIWVSAL